MAGIAEALDKALDKVEENENNSPTDDNKANPPQEDGDVGKSGTTAETEEGSDDGEESGESEPAGGDAGTAEDEQQREIAAGLELIKALKDPQSRREMIQYLAKESGFNLSEATPKEKKLFEKSLSEVLKETLVDEYALLPEKFADTLEEIISAKVNERLKPIETELLAAKEKAHKDSLQAELDWAYTNLNGFKKHENAILAKMQKLYKSPDASVRDYLTDLYNVVVPVEERGKNVKSTTSPSQTERTDRLKLQTGGSGKQVAKAPSKTPAPANKSLDEALEAALDQQGV